jgi:hypothetical protein
MSGFRPEDIETMYMGHEYVILLFVHFIAFTIIWFLN